MDIAWWLNYLYKSLSLLELEDNLKAAKFMYQLRNRQIPIALAEHFVNVFDIHSYNTKISKTKKKS